MGILSLMMIPEPDVKEDINPSSCPECHSVPTPEKRAQIDLQLALPYKCGNANTALQTVQNKCCLRACVCVCVVCCVLYQMKKLKIRFLFIWSMTEVRESYDFETTL